MKRTIKLIFPIFVVTIITMVTTAIAWDNSINQIHHTIQETPNTTNFATYSIPSITTYLSEPEPELEFEPAAYQEIANTITEEEIETLARLLFLEAGNQSVDGQRAVIEVVFNRVLSDEFPNTINDVVYAKNQFSPAHLIPSTTPTEEQYEVIQIVLTNSETVLDRGVVFFSRGQYNDYLFDKIGDHYFCYSTKSYENKMKGTIEP